MGEELAGVIVSVVFFLVVGLVILLAPIAKRLGSYLEVLIEERRAGLGTDADAGARKLVEGLERRIASIEDRLEFTERLLSRPRPDAEPDSMGGEAAGTHPERATHG